MKDKVFSIPLKNITLESNEQYDLKKVSLKLLKDGAVASHGLYIDTECLNTMQNSINLKPILCAYETDDEGNKTDFKGHEITYKAEKNGQTIIIKKVYIEQPVGVLEDSNFKIETIDDESWVSCDGYLYNEYCEDAVRILEEADGEKSVSIEFKIVDGYNGEDKLYHVTNMHFLGVTLLGESRTPAISGANITQFSQKQNALFATQFEKIVEHVNKLKNIKGGNEVRDKIIEKFESLKGNVEFETIISDETLSDEDLESKLFALSNSQIARAVRETVQGYEVDYTNRWNETYKIQKYYVEDIISEDNIVICEDNENYYAYYGIPFTMEGDKAVVDFANAKRYIRGDWREYQGSVEEIAINPTFSKEIDTIIEKLNSEVLEKDKIKNDLDDIKVKFAELQSANEEMSSDLERLKSFETEVLEKQKEEELNELLAKFEKIKDIEGFEEIVNIHKDNSIEELEKNLKVFAYDNGVTLSKKGEKKSFSKEPQLIKTINPTHTEELSEAELRYGLGIRKFMTNY